ANCANWEPVLRGRRRAEHRRKLQISARVPHHYATPIRAFPIERRLRRWLLSSSRSFLIAASLSTRLTRRVHRIRSQSWRNQHDVCWTRLKEVHYILIYQII